MSTIYAEPGENFFATLDNAPTGLVGVLGVRIIDLSDESEFMARTVAGIVEAPAGSGRYVFTGVAPVTKGNFAVFWDNGISPTTTASDELIVTTDIPPNFEPGYDVSTPGGKVRLLVSDVGGSDGKSFIFSDEEIVTFLSLKGEDVFLASALALRTIAANAVQISKRIKYLELSTDGPAEAEALRKLADSYVEQADEEYDPDIAVMSEGWEERTDRRRP